MKLSIIVPTYNEAENIKKLVPLLHSVLKNYDHEIVIVDDNSPDGTAKVAEKLAKQYPIKVLVREKKKGLASAIIYGFKNANGDILGVIDADLQHPPELIKNMAKKIEEGYDIVIASRYIKGGGTKGWPFHRVLISKIATLLAKPLTNVKDPMSGCFLLKRKVINNIDFNPIGYKILLEILVKGDYRKVAEVPYVFRNREYGESKMNIHEIIKYLHLLLHLYYYKLKSYKIFKHFLIMFFATILSYIFAYLFHIYMARSLGAYEYGILGTLLSLYYILSVPIGTIQTVIAKYISEFKVKNELGRVKYIAYNSTKVSGLFGLLLFMLLLLISNQISQFLHINSIYIILLSISASLYFLIPSLRGVLQGLEKFEWLGFSIIMEKFLILVFGFFLILLGLGAKGGILSYGIATGIVALIISYPLFQLKMFETIKCDINYRYILPVLFTFVCITTMISIDVIILKHKLTSNLTGKYMAMSMLGKVLYFTSLALATVMFPKSCGVHALNSLEHRRILKVSLLTVIGFCGVMLLIYTLFPSIVLKLLFGSEYADLANLLKFYGLAISLLSISIIIMFYLLSINRSSFIKYLFTFTILEVMLLYGLAKTVSDVLYIITFVFAGLLVSLIGVLIKELRKL